MSLPTLSGTGRLLDDPELRFAASGTAVCKVRIAFNSRKKDAQGNWADDKSFFINGTLFNQAAENCAESLQRGMEVVVSGRLCTDQWETKDGEKRSAPSLLIDSIGPVISNYQTAKVSKLDRSGGSSGSQRQTDGDPWASAAPAGSASSGYDTEPPF